MCARNSTHMLERRRKKNGAHWRVRPASHLSTECVSRRFGEIGLSTYCLGPDGGVVAGGVDVAGGVVVGPVVRVPVTGFSARSSQLPKKKMPIPKMRATPRRMGRKFQLPSSRRTLVRSRMPGWSGSRLCVIELLQLVQWLGQRGLGVPVPFDALTDVRRSRMWLAGKHVFPVDCVPAGRSR